MNKNNYKKIIFCIIPLLIAFFCVPKLDASATWMKASECISSGGKINSSKGYKNKYVFQESGTTMWKTAQEMRNLYDGKNYYSFSELIKRGIIKQEGENLEWVCCKISSPDSSEPTKPDNSNYPCTVGFDSASGGRIYYGINGNIVSESVYETQCKGRNDETKLYCTTSIDSVTGNTIYYGKYGSVVSKSVYDTQCSGNGGSTDSGDNCSVPDDEKTPTCDENLNNNVSCGGEIGDPELCNIMANKSKSYKVNGGNEYCDIYCREELILNFQDVVQVVAGRYFKHSITDKDSNIQNLSSVIEGHFECGSQIHYQKWKQDYRKANMELVSLYNTYAKYYVACNEGPEKLVNEEANCPGCSGECTINPGCPSPDCAEIVLPTTRPYSYSGDGNGTYKHYFTQSTRNYGYSTITSASCDFTSSTIVGSNPSTSWDSGSFSYSCGCSGYTCSRNDGESVCAKAGSAEGNLTQKKEQINDLVKALEDCNAPEKYVQNYVMGNIVTPGCNSSTPGGYEENYTYKNSYNISIANEYKNNIEITKTYNKSEKWSDYCGSCGSEYTTSSTPNTETLVKYDCNSTPSAGVYCIVKYEEYPSNGLVVATNISKSFHYQSTQFSTQLFTGKVVDGLPGTDYLQMPEFSWPIASNRKSDKYDLCYTISDLGSTDSVIRKNNPFSDIIDNTSCKYFVTNELNNYDCDDDYDGHECHGCSENDDSCHDGGTNDDADKHDSMGVFYRSVDLTDLFPNSKFSPYNKEKLNQDFKRVVGFNWINKDSVIDKIQSDGKDIWTTEPEFTVTLTPSAIKNIKDYNKNVNYLDVNREALNCSADNLNCTSSFLKDSKLVELGITEFSKGKNFSDVSFRYTKSGGGN